VTPHAAGWRPTPAHVRAVAATLALPVLAVLLRRADLLVLAAPLACAAAWGVARRPTREPVVRQWLGNAVVRDGEATTWHVDVTDPEGRVEDVATWLDAPRWTELRPAGGGVAVSLPDDGDDLDLVVRATRWGRRPVGPSEVAATSAWAAYRFVAGGGDDTQTLLVLPQPGPFDAASPPVHAPGLVGVNRSPRPGSGTEFASIRPFQPGDRLRRIHWPQSLRSGALHVTATWADHDRHVVLLVDALDDVGDSGGVDGAPSSLDVVVRAACAVAEHLVTSGDRVSLLVLGDRGVQRLAPASGRRQLRRVMEVLAGIAPLPARLDDGRVPQGLDHDALVVLLSALASPGARQRAYAVAQRGLAMLALDCLPPQDAARPATDLHDALGWRIRLLERDMELHRLTAAGVAVVPWRGPGSFDVALRDLQRRGASGVRRRA
jgi:uncharacterized protein (DUF58 family)